jgi:hypothetical protein
LTDERKAKLDELREKVELAEGEQKHLDLLIAVEKAEEAGEGLEDAEKELAAFEAPAE